MKKLLYLLIVAGFIMAQQSVSAQTVIPEDNVIVESSTNYNPTMTGPTSVQTNMYFTYSLSSLPSGWSTVFRVQPMGLYNSQTEPKIFQMTQTAAQVMFRLKAEHIVQFDIYDNTGAYWGWRSLRVNVNY